MRADCFHFVILVSGLCGYQRRGRPLPAVLIDGAMLEACDIENVVNTSYTRDVDEFKGIFAIFGAKSEGPRVTML